MPDLRIPLDPLNPGQFFACCGLFEVVALEAPLACARFEASEFTPRRADFIVEGDALPSVESILESLRGLSFTHPETHHDIEEGVRPISLQLASGALVLDWWLHSFWDRTTNLKCWAGQVTTRKLFEELPPRIDLAAVAEKGVMNADAMTKSKFGVDPRSAWNALDFGSSPNEQQRDTATYPAVEVLAAIGLQCFRPAAGSRDSVPYHLWTPPLPLVVARTAAVAAWEGLPRFDYDFSIAKRGQSYKFFEFARFNQRKVYYS